MRHMLGLVRYLWPHWRSLVVVLLTMGAGTAFGLLSPWPTKVLVDNVLGNQPLSGFLKSLMEFLPGDDGRHGLLLWVAIATIVIFVLGQGLTAVNTLVSTRLGQRMTYDLAADLFLHLQRLSPLYHGRHATGDTIARVTGDPTCVQAMVMSALIPLVRAIVTMVAMFVVMFALEPRLTLIALAITPFLVLSIRAFARPMKERSRERRDLEGRVMSVVETTLTSIPVVQAFAREELEHARFRRYADETVAAYQRANVVSLWFKFFAGLSTALGTAAVVYVGALLVLDGEMTIGTILVFLAYLGGLYGPLNAMTYTGQTIQYAAAQADRVMEILEVEPDVKDHPHARDADLRGSVRYENVTFGYREGRPVITDVSLEAEPGQVIAIVGPTGAGKTTMANLLVRFFDPWSGRITIDGHDLREYKVRSLRQQIAMVLQDPFIFPMSVAENIAYARGGRLRRSGRRPDATYEEIVAAARAANAHDYISSLPQGYDTVIGERGMTLSGGEKQRLSIARAFLKDAPILILDEPTSALDARTEGMLLDALERLMEGRLTFIIAHRLSTIRRADQIVVLEDGRISERGSHEELVQHDGLYAALYRQQMEIAQHDAEAVLEAGDGSNGTPAAGPFHSFGTALRDARTQS